MIRAAANAGVILLLLGSLSLPPGAVPAQAGHPLETDSPETEGRGTIEAEFNVDRANGKDGGHTTLLYNNDTLGLAPTLDLILVLPYLFDQADSSTPTVRGMSDIAVALKYRFLDQKGSVPGMAFSAGAFLPTGDYQQGLGNGRASGLFTAIAGWEHGDAGVYGNLRYLLQGRPIGSPETHDRIVASVAGSVPVTERLVALGEYVWDDRTDGGRPRSEIAAGGSVEVSENLSVNGGIRWGTTSSSSNVIYQMGVTYEFRGEGPAGKPGK